MQKNCTITLVKPGKQSITSTSKHFMGWYQKSWNLEYRLTMIKTEGIISIQCSIMKKIKAIDQ
jgi:hypothetical protein